MPDQDKLVQASQKTEFRPWTTDLRYVACDTDQFNYGDLDGLCLLDDSLEVRTCSWACLHVTEHVALAWTRVSHHVVKKDDYFSISVRRSPEEKLKKRRRNLAVLKNFNGMVRWYVYLKRSTSVILRRSVTINHLAEIILRSPFSDHPKKQNPPRDRKTRPRHNKNTNTPPQPQKHKHNQNSTKKHKHNQN